LSGTTGAQIPQLPTVGSSWTEVSYPKLYYTVRDGFTFGLYYAQQRPMGYEDYWDPEPYHAALTFDAQLSTSGRRQLRVEARLPKLVPGWRSVLTFSASRLPRDYYFGVGNATDTRTAVRSRFFQSDTRRIFLRGELQRRIVGGLRVLGGFHFERWRIGLPDGPSLIADDQERGVDPTIGRSVGDVTLRVGAVFDSRDDEVAPRRGVLLQAIYGSADSSLAGDLSYTRATASAAAYVSPGRQLVLAARVVGQTMGGTPRLGSYNLIESSDRPYSGIGGENSHRALLDQRFIDADKLLANLDVRFDLLSEETLYAVTALVFLDAGRVFQPGNLRLTTEDLRVGGGAGLFVRWGRSAVLGWTFGVGPDGVVFQVNSRWAY
jgi:outer membrane protein assembly factor BamA